MSSHAQVMRSLDKAQKAKAGMMQVKQAIAKGMPIEQALEMDTAGPITLYNLLKAKPRWGRGKVLQFIKRLRISESRRVRDLTVREKAEIARLLQYE